MAGTRLNGIAAGALALGSLFVYAGVKGYSVPHAIQALVSGQPPGTGGQANPIATPSGGSGSAGGTGADSALNPSPPGGATVAAYKAYALALLTAHGWAGQWSSFSAIVGEEDASWNPDARNPSGAYGIGQALGHGTAATMGSNGVNEYGGYGTSDATCKLANEGHGDAQLIWMMNYIGQVYGDPDKAQAFHLANGFY